MTRQDRPKTATKPLAVRHTFPVHPLWVTGALILAWLGGWVHEFYRVPAQFGFTFVSMIDLLLALLIFLAWWRFPRSFLPIYGMWVLAILHELGALSVLPLPIWPFVTEQTVSHYLVHGVSFLAQIPLLLLTVKLMGRLRGAPHSLLSAR